MARSRNIKPGFFTNEDLVELDFATRLLFAGLWTQADRDGRLEDRPKKLKMAIFPADNVDVDAMLASLHSAKLIVRYEVNGVQYIRIPSWSKHQNPHHTEKASEIPEENGVLTVKAPVENGEVTVSAVLIPDSLFIDSLSSASLELPTKKRSSPKSELPDEFHPNDAGIKAAEVAGFDVALEVDKFRDHHRANDTKFADWQAAWRTWIRKAVEFRAARGGKPAPNAGSDAPAWLTGTGFPNVWEANNAGCFASNAAQFRKAAV